MRLSPSLPLGRLSRSRVFVREIRVSKIAVTAIRTRFPPFASFSGRLWDTSARLGTPCPPYLAKGGQQKHFAHSTWLCPEWCFLAKNSPEASHLLGVDIEFPTFLANWPMLYILVMRVVIHRFSYKSSKSG